MKLLMFGQTGQVAREVLAWAGAGLEVQALGRGDCDLSDPAACAAVIAASTADAVLNAAAYTAVDKAEAEEALATVINGEAPGAMAEACAARGVPFVHISTDYVFDGTGEAAWSPGDRVSPVNAYGRSKLAGEVAIAQAGGAAAVMRTSWVFSAHGGNFVKSMLRLGAERERLAIVDDQHGGPTWAGDIASAAIRMARVLCEAPHKAGTYHFSGAPDVSWAAFAREIFAQADVVCEVTPITSADFPTPAARPANSRLDCSATEAAFGLPRPDWREGLARVLRELS
ncbi:dTDP-4-dehydrorhamnose reductase [Vannielia sp.]|uniref:dTDP-4-dehydrorhamnose reductase n=1 Tax=Vannielia sp. TaxID=2813045 RepID=UPI0026141836|nr:dTDP-4-dehydrorhamnose reductase [Vannielia sp.]MDF1872310.1 dTDP-4-dehydrorhamnose reductase [Vannielia sp.]